MPKCSRSCEGPCKICTCKMSLVPVSYGAVGCEFNGNELVVILNTVVSSRSTHLRWEVCALQQTEMCLLAED